MKLKRISDYEAENGKVRPILSKGKASDNKTIIEVDPGSLVIPDAQRDQIESHIEKIAKNYDHKKSGVISAVRNKKLTGDALFVYEGFQRATAGWRAGAETVYVEVVDVDFDTIEELNEYCSEMFLAANDKKPLTVYDKFKNELKTGHAWAVELDKIVKSVDCVIHHRKSKDAGYITHIAWLKKIYFEFGREVLINTLSFIRKNWSSEPIDGTIMVSLARFFFYNKKNSENKYLYTTINETILYSALTASGNTQTQVRKHLEKFRQITNSRGTSQDIAKARAIYSYYNDLALLKNVPMLSTNGVY